MVSIIACRRISSLPDRAKLSRAPAFTRPSVRVCSSIAMTCAFWLSMIQANRRLALTASRISGHNRRTSANPTDPEDAGAALGADGTGALAAGALGAGAVDRPDDCAELGAGSSPHAPERDPELSTGAWAAGGAACEAAAPWDRPADACCWPGT